MNITPDLARMLERAGIATSEQAEALRNEIEDHNRKVDTPVMAWAERERQASPFRPGGPGSRDR